MRYVKYAVGLVLVAVAAWAGASIASSRSGDADDSADSASYEDRICEGMERALRAEATDWNDGGGPEALEDSFDAVHEATEPDVVDDAHPVIVEVDEKLHLADNRSAEGRDEVAERLIGQAYETLGTFCYAQNRLSGQAEAMVTGTDS